MRGFVLLLLVIGLIVGHTMWLRSTEKTIQVTVTKTERIVDGTSDAVTSKYMVYSQAEVLQNTDSLLYGKFDSSDTYAAIVPGRTYSMRVYGFRVPFLSMYRNIISAKPVD